MHIMLRSLTAAAIPAPEHATAETKVVRERDLEGFHVAKGRDWNGIYYTVRNATAWPGFKIANSIGAVRTIIKEA